MTEYWKSFEFIKRIPKSDLHVHLDGSLRLETLIELAQQQGVKLPSYTPSGLEELVFKDHYQNLVEYLNGFQYTCAVLRDAESLERVAYELAWDNYLEGVRYIEPRFAPQLNAHDTFSIEEVLCAVDRGLKRAQKEINQSTSIQSGVEPEFHYGIVACAMRKFNEHFSPYYQKLISCHAYTDLTALYPIASLELVRALVDIRDRKTIPIVGFDLAGEEHGWPASSHQEAYVYAHQHFLKRTVHAGEAYGPASIFQAITDCYADRIGHGTHLFASELVTHLPPEERQDYTQALVEYIGERRITIEVCPTSNLQTISSIRDISQHPVGRMIRERLSVSLCTDNRLVSKTTVSDEVLKTVQGLEVSAHDLREIMLYGFKRGFIPLSYPEKRRYVRKIIDYYDRIEKEFQDLYCHSRE